MEKRKSKTNLEEFVKMLHNTVSDLRDNVHFLMRRVEKLEKKVENEGLKSELSEYLTIQKIIIGATLTFAIFALISSLAYIVGGDMVASVATFVMGIVSLMAAWCTSDELKIKRVNPLPSSIIRDMEVRRWEKC